MFIPPANTSDTVVSLTGVRKSFRQGGIETEILRGIDLTVERGEFVFLAGPSGSGKSTLLSILGCLLTPQSGRVEILGSNVAELDNRQRTLLRRDRIGFVFQRFYLLRGLSVLDNVCLPLTLRGETSERAGKRARDLLAAVGLGDKLTCDPRRLSAGQCQRVALARALASDPDLILADEPTASLDAASGLQAIELLRELARQEHKTAIVVTHDTRIFGFADRILHLENGAICSPASPASLGEMPPGPNFQSSSSIPHECLV